MKTNRKTKSRRRRSPRQHQRQRHLCFELLEDRRMLAGFEFQQKIYAEQLDPEGMNLGESVAVDGDYAVIGASNTLVLNGTSDVFSGTAYIYRRHDPGTPGDPNDDFWLFQKQLIPTDLVNLSSDNFGISVAISGDTVAVGASSDDSGNSNAGAVYIFQKDVGGADRWGEVTKVTHSLAGSGDAFGNSIAIDNDTLVVGSLGDDDFGSASGSAIVFERDFGGTDNWGERTTLFASDAASNDNFGRSVGISGDTIVIGSPNDSDFGSFSGSAYVFQRDLGGADAWGEAQKLNGSTINSSDLFGYAVSIDVDTIAVGAYNAISGDAFIFERNQGGAENWGETIVIDGPSGTDGFGWSIDVQGDALVVGARFDNNQTGEAYVFGRDQGGADQWGQVQRIAAPDGTTFEDFGFSVAISGETVFVGAYEDDDGRIVSNATEIDLGSGYIFGQDVGGADQWGLQQKITASNPKGGEESATTVAIDGNTMVVGAPLRNREFGTNAGEAYVFERHDAGTPADLTDDLWLFSATLFASDDDDDDNFGASVAISGDTIVVGAPLDDEAAADAGAVYVFDRNLGGSEAWGPRKKLAASNAAVSDSFGYSVSIDADTIVVGALVGDGGIADTGSAYVFERNNGASENWGEVTKLVASNEAVGDEFGHSVGISGDTIIVGARLGDNGVADVGAVYIYDRGNGGPENWGETRQVNASDAAAGDDFGFSVWIDGDTAIVGAPLNGNGAAYVLGRDQGSPDNWGEVTIITASDGAADDQFGVSVSLDGDTAIVGANLDDNSTDTGSAYVFDRNDGGTDNWGQLFKVTAPDATDNDEFGTAVAISGNHFVVGAPKDDDGGADSGAAYQYVITRDVSVEVLPATVFEDGATNLEFTFTRTGSTAEGLFVYFDVNGVATPGDDFTLTGAETFGLSSGSVIIPSGSSSATVTVDPTPDAWIEGGETLILSLATDPNYSIGTPAGAVGTILNDDEVQLTVSPDEVDEDGATNLVYTFERASTAGALTVNFDIVSEPTLGVDYTQSGADTFDVVGGTGSITFPDTVDTVTLTIDPTADAVVELDETIVLTLAPGAGYTVSLPVDVAGTILNDDMATIAFDNVNVAGDETDGVTTFTFDVTLTGEVDTDVTLMALTRDGLATAGSDYTAIGNQTVTFTGNTTSPQTRQVDVTVTGEDIVELDEDFFVNIAGIEAGGRNVKFAGDGGVGLLTSQVTSLVSSSSQVIDFAMTPDGLRSVYVADQDTDEVFELYSVSSFGGEITKLNAPLVSGGDIGGFEGEGLGTTFQISPDGATVVYRADQDTDGVVELYGVSIDGGTPVKLNGMLVSGGDVGGFQISGDSSHVVYRADQDANGETELFSVPIGGGTAVKLNGTLAGGYDVRAFEISEDGATVVYTADENTPYLTELFSVPITGGTPTKLNGALAAGIFNSLSFAISQDSAQVVYVTDQDADNVEELFSVPINGGAQTKLNATLPTNGDVRSEFLISNDSSTVVYVADQDTDGVDELYSVSISGGAPTKLNGTLVAGGNVIYYGLGEELGGDSRPAFQISQDDTTVVYVADQDTDNLFELFSVPITGGTSVKLNGPLAAGEESGALSFEISVDSTRVVYHTDQDTIFVDELYSVPLGGGAVTKLNDPLPTSGEVREFRLSPDGQTAFFSVLEPTAGGGDSYALRLFAVPTGGGVVEELSTVDPGANETVLGFRVAPDATAVAYVQTLPTTANSNLFTSVAARQATGTINNDDTATVTVANVSASEALGEITFTATLDGDVDTSFYVNFQTTDGTATDGSDYVGLVSDGESPDDLFFDGTDGATATQKVNVFTDNVVELNETFTFDLLSQDSGRSGITLVDGTGTILNDDTATLSVTGGSVTEGDSGQTSLDFEVKLLGFIQGGLDVPYMTADGSATTGDGDYDTKSDTLNFAGTSFVDIQSVSVDVNGDETVELDESFQLALGTLAAAQADTNAIIVVGDPGMGLIENDDSATLSIAADVAQPETDSGLVPFTFTANLTNPVDQGVIVSFDVLQGTATFADGDLTTTGGSFGIPAGSTSATFSVLVNGDGKIETDETFTVDLSAFQAAGRAVSFGDKNGLGTIENDDAIGFTVTESGGDTEVSETGTVDSFSVVLEAEPDSAVVIDILNPDPSEVSLSASSLTFDRSNWDVAQAVVVTGVNDDDLDGDKSVDLTITINDLLSDDGFDALSDQTVNVVNLDHELDFGDAPDPTYATLLDSNGPRHVIGSLMLGTNIDQETDGQPNADATGDDISGGDDEDGLVGFVSFIAGGTGRIDVRSSANAKLDAWIDFDGNGTFDHATEHLNGGVSYGVVAGVNEITFDVPDGAPLGASFLRLRLSSAGNLLPTGPADDGEVEDYAVAIQSCLTTVLNTNDSGTGSLREAIACSNSAAGVQLINFNIPGVGPHTIQPLSALPGITDAVIIDGKTEPDFAGTPVIEIDGSLAGGSNGLTITTGGSGSVIRGLAVNGFAGHGLVLADSDGNTIAGNFVGTDVTGAVDLGNGKTGIFLSGADNNTIGGTAPGDRNVISGNTQQGIRVSFSSNNVVQGNLLGTTASGTTSLENLHGISVVNSAGNLVGGTNEAARNVISGNQRYGVQITGAPSSGNRVEGNFIGVDATGSADLGNHFQGVVLAANASSNTIGGIADGAGNAISGNDKNGILLLGGANNSIQGNLIGTDATGSVARGNTLQGIAVTGGANGHTLGGTDAGAGNVVSANGQHGIRLAGGSSGIVVQNNLIGTDVTGTFGLGNTLNGITISNASLNQIGGTAAGAGNVISDNRRGVLIQLGGSTGNLIQGNRIGTGVTGSALGNDFEGIRIVDGASFNRIGGTTVGAGNVIAHNGTQGIELVGGTGNAIQQNSISDNGGLGIDLNDDGVTANDAEDADPGTNLLQNFPVITSATRDGENVDIVYSVPSLSVNSTFPLTVEFFLTDAGGEEGKTFLGTHSYTTEGSTPTVTFPEGSDTTGSNIVATATDANGNTSEFSAAVTVSNPLLAAGGALDGAAQSQQTLMTADLEFLAAAALERLTATGLRTDQLDKLSSIRFAVADLRGDTLALATDTTITVDLNAAGYGWYVDRTASLDEEFARRGQFGLQADQEGPAAGRMDLLTVILHEMGHILGHDDDYSNPQTDHIMNGWLETATRRLPSTGAIDQVFADLARYE